MSSERSNCRQKLPNFGDKLVKNIECGLLDLQNPKSLVIFLTCKTKICKSSFDEKVEKCRLREK